MIAVYAYQYYQDETSVVKYGPADDVIVNTAYDGKVDYCFRRR